MTLPMTGMVIFSCLLGCSTNSQYHTKKHLDTIKKDLDAAHKDIDTILGLEEPSPLVEER